MNHRYLPTIHFDRYIADELPKRNSDHEKFAFHIEWWRKRIGHIILIDLSPSELARCRDELMKEPNGRYDKKGNPQTKAPATIWKYMTTLSIVLNIAVKEWEWLDQSPMSKVRKPKVSNERDRFLSVREREKLLDACRRQNEYTSYHPEWLYNLVIIRLCTGMRPTEGRCLKWSEINFDEGIIRIKKTKNGEPLTVPVPETAMKILLEMYEVRRRDCDWVFPRADGQAPLDFRKRFYHAVKAAGLEDFHFHDLRHTTASYLAMQGASLREIAEVLNHKTLTVTKRYAHLSQEHTKKLLNRLDEGMFGGEGDDEYVYFLIAKEAGIKMTECHLFKANKGAGYFATKRFARDGEKLHFIEYISADLGFERGVNEESTLVPVTNFLLENGFELVDISHYRICALFRNKKVKK